MAATYVKPGELGLNPEKLTEMLTELEQTVEIHSISVRFDGKVILEGAWEPFSLEKPQMMHSLSKIGTSICLGFALDEGKIHLEDKLLDYVRDELPEEYDPALEDLTIYHLLTMQAGSKECCNNVWFSKLTKDWETNWLKQPKIREDIGKAFHYDSGCSYTLSRIVTKVMGKNCLALMQERVFDKMGFGEINWLTSPEGHNTGGWGMYLTAGKISALAQLLLQKGEWNGEQLIPAWWTEEIGKMRVVIPEDEKKALTHYAYHIKAGKEIFAAEAQEKLEEKLVHLTLPKPEGDKKDTNEATKKLLNKRIVFTENPRQIESAVISTVGEELKLELTVAGEKKIFFAGYKDWKCNDMYPNDFTKRYHAVSYAFDEDALYLSVGLLNTSYREEYCLWVNSENVVVGTWRPNVTYLPAEEDMTWKFTGTFEPSCIL